MGFIDSNGIVWKNFCNNFCNNSIISDGNTITWNSTGDKYFKNGKEITDPEEKKQIKEQIDNGFKMGMLGLMNGMQLFFQNMSNIFGAKNINNMIPSWPDFFKELQDREDKDEDKDEKEKTEKKPKTDKKKKNKKEKKDKEDKETEKSNGDKEAEEPKEDKGTEEKPEPKDEPKEIEIKEEKKEPTDQKDDEDKKAEQPVETEKQPKDINPGKQEEETDEMDKLENVVLITDNDPITDNLPEPGQTEPGQTEEQQGQEKEILNDEKKTQKEMAEQMIKQGQDILDKNQIQEKPAPLTIDHSKGGTSKLMSLKEIINSNDNAKTPNGL